ncbi:APC family permease [Paractinoplanes deccanensis]|uniref:APC family permease n=1 Tax=Paractinoplanes deccanensis TaxID=113561 RepID=UPI001EF24629|nr:APC family permease [Actinoplanes deccanensis]
MAKNRLGVWAVLVQVLAAAAPLTVIAGGATGAWAISGQRGVPIAYVAVAVVLGIFALPYVAMARQIPNAGAFYMYVTAGLGRVAGSMTAFVALLSYNAMQVGLYGGIGYEASNFLESQFGWDTDWYWCAFAAWLVVGTFGLLRIDFSAKLLGALLIAEIAIALILAAVHVTHPAGGTVSFATLSPSSLFASSAGVLATIAIAGFVGFENTTVLAEEARDPRRTIPIATFAALLTIGLLYGFCAWAVTVRTGPDNIVARAGEESTSLIFNLAADYLPAFVIIAGHIFFVTSLFAAALSFHNTSNRYAYALGRDGILPAAFGRAWQKTQAPVAASLLQTLIGFAVIYLYTIAGWDPYAQLFFWITASAGLGVLTLMVLTSFAMLGYFIRQRTRRRADSHDTSRGTPAWAGIDRTRPRRVSVWRGVLCPIVAGGLLSLILWQTVANFHLLLGVDAGDRLRWYFPSAILIFALLGVVVALVLKLAKPTVYARIGQGGAIAELRSAR